MISTGIPFGKGLVYNKPPSALLPPVATTIVGGLRSDAGKAGGLGEAVAARNAHPMAHGLPVGETPQADRMVLDNAWW